MNSGIKADLTKIEKALDERIKLLHSLAVRGGWDAVAEGLGEGTLRDIVQKMELTKVEIQRLRKEADVCTTKIGRTPPIFKLLRRQLHMAVFGAYDSHPIRRK